MILTIYLSTIAELGLSLRVVTSCNEVLGGRCLMNRIPELFFTSGVTKEA